MKNYKKAMVLAEVMLAFSVCAVIFVLLVLSFKPVDIQIKPYTYFITHDLVEANQILINKCKESGHCQEESVLPESPATYCQFLTENFSNVSFSDCTNERFSNAYPGSFQRTDFVVLNTGNNSPRVELKKNIQFANGIAIYGLTSVDDEHPLEWRQGAENFAPYINAFIDTKGNNNDFTRGVEVFPIRIFRNGEIIPGFDFARDRNAFSYNVVLNRESDTGGSINKNSRIKQAIDGGVDISFRDAVCYTDRNLLEKYYFAENGNFGEGVNGFACPENHPVIRNGAGENNGSPIDIECRPNGTNSTFCEIIPHKFLVTGLMRISGF